MNKDNHLIYEGYSQKRNLTPKESLQRDKEFFNYVIESNDHLFSLKKFSTKKLFSSYVFTLANRIESNNPGLIRESNMSDAEAFGILNEATKSVSDQEAYDAVKDIFEEVALKQLIRKADILLEQQRSFVKRGVGGPIIKNPDGSTSQVRQGVGGKTITQNQPAAEPVADQPAGKKPLSNDPKNVARRQQRALNKHRLDQRSGTAQRMRDLRAANQAGAARIAELEAKIQEMEAAEANMNQQQKAQSDAIQDQLAAMIKQIQTNNTATAANQNVINIGGPGAGTEGNPNTSQGQLNTPGNQGQLNATNNTDNSIAQNAEVANQKGNPGMLSKLGSAAKKYLLNPTTLGALGAGAGTLIPGVGNAVGGAIGGALGKGLGRAFQTKGNLGKKLGAGLGGAATGGLAGAGIGAGVDAYGNYLGGDGDDIPTGSLGGPNPDGTTFDPDTGASTSYPAGYEANLREPGFGEPVEPKVYPKGQNISEPPTGRIPKGTTPTR